MSTGGVIMTAVISQDQNGFENDDFDERIITSSRLKQKPGNRKKPRKGVANDDDFDDNASVSSSMSSASEHSVKSDTKVKKTKRQHCEVHSKASKSKIKENLAAEDDDDDDAVERIKKPEEGPDGGEAKETSKANQAKCTCRKSVKSKSTGKAKVTRPEPEGSLLSDPSKSIFMDDLERVIYSNEPIFSDVEDEDPLVKEQIRNESERFHKRIQEPENIFSAIQMLNTNTMMKLAIIQTELKNVKDVSLRRSEAEIVSAAKRAEVLHESFNHTESSFKSVSTQLGEALKAVRLYESQQPPMQKGSSDDKRQVGSIDKEPQRVGIVSPDVISKRRSFYGKRLFNEVDLELAECSLEAAEMKICEIEEEQMVISNARKSRNTSEFEDIIRRLSQHQLQAEKQARDSEQAILYLGKQLSDLQEERAAEKKKYKPISNEIKASFADLSVFLS